MVDIYAKCREIYTSPMDGMVQSFLQLFLFSLMAQWDPSAVVVLEWVLGT